jgi:hypothetical protein
MLWRTRQIGTCRSGLQLGTNRTKILIGVVLGIAVLAAVGTILATSSWSGSGDAAGVGSSATSATPVASGAHPRSFTHSQYARSFALATIGKTSLSVLDSWPPPYQTYHDEYLQRCFEWYDRGRALYNLCFKANGILALKIIE